MKTDITTRLSSLINTPMMGEHMRDTMRDAQSIIVALREVERAARALCDNDADSACLGIPACGNCLACRLRRSLDALEGK